MSRGVINAAYFVPPNDLSEVVDRSDLVVKARAGELSADYGFEWLWPACTVLAVVVVHVLVRRRRAKRLPGLLYGLLAFAVVAVAALSVRVYDVLPVVVDETLYGSVAAPHIRIDVAHCPVILDRSLEWVLFLEARDGRMRPAWPGHFAFAIAEDRTIRSKRGSAWTYDRLNKELKER